MRIATSYRSSRVLAGSKERGWMGYHGYAVPEVVDTGIYSVEARGHREIVCIQEDDPRTSGQTHPDVSARCWAAWEAMVAQGDLNTSRFTNGPRIIRRVVVDHHDFEISVSRLSPASNLLREGVPPAAMVLAALYAGSKRGRMRERRLCSSNLNGGTFGPRHPEGHALDVVEPDCFELYP